MEDWFLSEFGPYGFTLSPTMYDPYNFMLCKVVMVRDRNGLFKTNIKITPDLADDVRGWGVPYDHHVEGLRELVRVEIRRQYGHLMNIDFKPNKKITKLKFI
jgi:hypothetical protein